MSDLYVFITYSHQDKEHLSAVESVLAKLNIKYFRDEHSIRFGDEIRTEVISGLNRATDLLIILSKNAEKSGWMPFEIGYALAKEMRMVSFSVDPALPCLTFLPNSRCITELSDLESYFSAQGTPRRGVQDPREAVTKKRLSWNDIGQGLDILVQYAERTAPDVIYGICRGGPIVGNMIAKRLGFRAAATEIWVDAQSAKAVLLEARIAERFASPAETQEALQQGAHSQASSVLGNHPKILLVDDAIHNGTHLFIASEHLKRLYPNGDIQCMVMLKTNVDYPNPSVPREPIEVDFFAYRADQHIVPKLPWDK